MENCKKCGMLKITKDSKCACTTKKKKKSSGIKQVSDKKKERLKMQGTEIELFLVRHKMFKNIGENVCMVTGENLSEELPVECFPHILPKGKFPELRYFLNNIGLVKGINEHTIFDARINKYKKEYGLINLIKDIKDGKEVYRDIINFNNK